MHVSIFKRGFRLVALFCVLTGISGVLDASGYLGCAEGRRGAYCWGSNTGSKGCMEAAFGTCVLFYTQLCPP